VAILCDGLRRCENRGLALSEYVEELIADLDSRPGRKQEGTEAYLNRVRKVLGKFGELPRLASELGADRIIGYDHWGPPQR
jgi:hypothetical protein